VFDAEIIDGKDAEVSVHINDYDSIDHFQDTHAGMITVTTGSSGHRVYPSVKSYGRRNVGMTQATSARSRFFLAAETRAPSWRSTMFV